MPSPESLADVFGSAAHASTLTPRQVAILRQMAAYPEDDEGELVYERGAAYLGDERVASRTVFALLRLCAISAVQFSGGVGAVERYRIESTVRVESSSFISPVGAEE